jgi:iron-sulfur cluster repair protein YtfE (RIC family)
MLHDALTTTRHRELEIACDQLVGAAFEQDPHAFESQWEPIDCELREHMATEEQWLFPKYARSAPELVDQLRREHAELRALLDEIKGRVTSHGIHAERLRRLSTLLHAHAAKEDASVYRWAATS